GRSHRYAIKRTTSGLITLDVNYLSRNGNFTSNQLSYMTWSRDNEAICTINTRMEGPHLVLGYKRRLRNGDWQSSEESVLLSYTSCNYGGRRPWFICPGVKNGVPCQRRVAKLYAAGSYLLCRHCYDLAYDSQRELERHRLLYKAQNIRRHLGGSANITEPFPFKPKGMHWNPTCDYGEWQKMPSVIICASWISGYRHGSPGTSFEV
ncbi:hypothetical protein ACFLXU_05235, partial [Chloroflexota bacterium]